jgi:RimJ/RimL family protein N-acetyltransferase
VVRRPSVYTAGVIRVRTYPDVRAFLARSESWLLRAEQRYGLLLGIADQVLRGVHRYRQPIYWATVEEDWVDGAVADYASLVGCAFRTPPHQVGVTELPAAAIEPLVASLRETYLNLPGVAGPEPTATAFADAWTARFGGKWWLEQRQRLHSVTRVTLPSAPASGALRPALPPDAPVARAWMAGFIRDTRARHLGADAAERLIEQQRLHIWVDGEPRCMVSAVRDTPNTAGIGAVYTPPQFRNRGYASTAVATLSRQLLDSGRRSCFLYTDVANPVSNAVYARVGFEPIDDVVEIKIL